MALAGREQPGQNVAVADLCMIDPLSEMILFWMSRHQPSPLLWARCAGASQADVATKWRDRHRNHAEQSTRVANSPIDRDVKLCILYAAEDHRKKSNRQLHESHQAPSPNTPHDIGKTQSLLTKTPISASSTNTPTSDRVSQHTSVERYAFTLTHQRRNNRQPRDLPLTQFDRSFGNNVQYVEKRSIRMKRA